MGETIMREICPKCNKYAYYNLGDLDDCTITDSDGGRCPWCGHSFLWEGSDEIMKCEKRNIEDANYIDGKRILQVF